MDPETSELILNMQLQDLNELQDQQKGKQRAGEMTNLEIAIELQLEEVKQATIAFNDQQMCISIARAIDNDGHFIDSIREQENQIHQDQTLAQNLSDGTQNSSSIPHPNFEQENSETLSRLSLFNIAQNDNNSM